MDDKTQLIMLYENMYQFMIKKDIDKLAGILSDEFSLHHMTGMVQGKQDFLKAVRQGTLNYFSAVHEKINVQITGNCAQLIGDSQVLAAVFGGGRHTWRLRQTISCKKEHGTWVIEKSVASVY
ncbi:MAG: nuclear transport factor 2 family protein [Clostridium sp.]|nr:nuclear transport factor 2 family protein [Clostridium sp.]MCM1459107.1 nuclear transport factor 2 family protein [Bacteroides sp.]